MAPSDIPLKTGTLSGFGLRLREARKRARITQQTLSVACGVTRASIAQWEVGKTSPTLSHLKKAVVLLDTKVSSLLGEDNSDGQHHGTEPPRTDRRVPLIDFRLAANLEQEKIQKGAILDFMRTEQLVSQAAFALEIRDDSLGPEIRRGDRLIADPSIKPNPGDFVVAHVLIEDEAIVRKYRPQAGRAAEIQEVELAAINLDWPSIIIDADNPGRIVGTVVELRRHRLQFS